MSVFDFVIDQQEYGRSLLPEIADKNLRDILSSLYEVYDGDSFSSCVDKYADLVSDYGYINIYIAKFRDKDDICKSLIKQYFLYSVYTEFQQFKNGMNTIGNFGNQVWNNRKFFEIVLSTKRDSITWISRAA